MIAAALVVLLALALPRSTAQDAAKDPKKPAVKKPSLEDAIARAFKRVRRVDDQKLLRATVVKGTLADDESYLIVCEFGTGDVGIFEGSVEPQTDQFFMLEKRNAEILAEITRRAASR